MVSTTDLEPYLEPGLIDRAFAARRARRARRTKRIFIALAAKLPALVEAT